VAVPVLCLCRAPLALSVRGVASGQTAMCWGGCALPGCSKVYACGCAWAAVAALPIRCMSCGAALT
jgi:hypothetical protein